MFWGGFLVGALAGAAVGVGVMCLLFLGRHGGGKRD